MEEVLQALFGFIFLGAHTVQTVPKMRLDAALNKTVNS